MNDWVIGYRSPFVLRRPSSSFVVLRRPSSSFVVVLRRPSPSSFAVVIRRHSSSFVVIRRRSVAVVAVVFPSFVVIRPLPSLVVVVLPFCFRRSLSFICPSPSFAVLRSSSSLCYHCVSVVRCHLSLHFASAPAPSVSPSSACVVS